MRKKRAFSGNPQLLPEMFGSDASTDSEEPAQKLWLKDFLIPLGSFLIAALALLTQYAQLPRWIIVVAVSYLIFVAGVSLYISVGRVASYIASKWRFRRVAKTYFPRVLESIGVLHQLLERGQTNTLLYLLGEAAQWGELRGRPSLFDPEHVEIMRSWLFSIEGRVESCTRGEFSSLCSEISELTGHFNRFCHQRLRALQEVITAGALPEQRLRQLKQQWNLHREAHVAYIRGWQNLTKTINEKAGARLCMDYYEPLGTLE